MKKVFVPDAAENPKALSFLTSEERQHFRQKSQSLAERADQMAADCCVNPQEVSESHVAELARDICTLAVQLLEAGMEKGEPLPDEEQALYQFCKCRIQEYGEMKNNMIDKADPQPKPAGSRRTLFNTISSLRNSIEQTREFFQLTAEKEIAESYIIQAGSRILPGYADLINGMLTNKPQLLPFLASTAIDVAEAQAECALLYQDNKRIPEKKIASEMLDIAGYAYQGHPESKKGEFRKLAEHELPEQIRVLYDASQGVLTASRGLKVWLGKKKNRIVVSFSGTDFKNPDMVYADIVQLSEPSILYLKAAGLLNLLLEFFPDKEFYVTGHSLGGGLTQFSLTANIDTATDRMTGYAYNPAGLSMASLRHLGDVRLKAASAHMWIFTTRFDPVSAVGGKIGCLTPLPETDTSGHFLVDVKACMKKYLDEPVVIVS